MTEKTMVKLTVNTSNLVKNLKYAFASPFSVVTELMQNARRAGASRVAVSHDATSHDDVLTVVDDGSGIDDFQSLFSIAESGWGDEILEEEGPYGMGFMVVIHNCESVVIQSNGRRVTVDTERLLGFEEVEVEDDPGAPARGSRITARGWKTDACGDVAAMVRRHSAGFPIVVTFNGEEVPRPDAPFSVPSAPPWRWSKEVGWLRIPGMNLDFEGDDERARKSVEELAAPCSIRYYLQGLPIKRTWGEDMRDGLSAVVHLNPRRFRGVMPDRKTVVNEDEMAIRVTDAIGEMWRARLAVLKQRMSSKRFATLMYPLVSRYKCLELLDDIPYLPPQVLGLMRECPRIHLEYEDNYDGDLYDGPALCARDFEVGRAKVTDEPEEENDSWIAPMYVYLTSTYYLNNPLAPTHWIHKHLIGVGPEDIRLEIHGGQPAVDYQGYNICGSVRVQKCSHYVLSGPLGAVTAFVPWLWNPGEDDLGGRIIFPIGARDASVICQLNAFDEDSPYYNVEDAIEEEKQRLLAFIQNDPAESSRLLEELLRGAGLCSYPSLMLHDGYTVRIRENPDNPKAPLVTVTVIDDPKPTEETY